MTTKLIRNWMFPTIMGFHWLIVSTGVNIVVIVILKWLMTSIKTTKCC